MIRNFAIIAHVDHGKSTLADRFMELTGVVAAGTHEAQLLDRNPISRERGITIKLAPVTMTYGPYTLNLVDTPGHVDFSYEVERTLACVDGVILLVDATQGIQAQTIAHAYKALELNLPIIPVVNKIDMEHAMVEETINELVQFLGVKRREVSRISAKTGLGVRELLDRVINVIPKPTIPPDDTLCSATIFDSYYDPYRGVIAFIRTVSGTFTANAEFRLIATNRTFVAQEVGIFLPDLTKQAELAAGSIGYIVTSLKDIHDVRVGDTIRAKAAKANAIPGYKESKPMVFASVFPTEPDDFPLLKKAMDKLTLNDAALQYSQIGSQAFGAGLHVGFLGLLHADVTRERLEREFGQSVILTPPQVEYQKKGETFLEPVAKLTVVTRPEYVGAVMRLCDDSRGIFTGMDNARQVVISYEMPLVEIITSFFDRLKTITSGYASIDWELIDYREVKAERLQILLNGTVIDEFSEIVVAERAEEKARFITSRLRELIPRQQFEVRIQAVYQGRIIASERISPLRKDVTAGMYGGDRTRKDKLLNKQKKGKKLMKQVGTVTIPKETFMKLFQEK